MVGVLLVWLSAGSDYQLKDLSAEAIYQPETSVRYSYQLKKVVSLGDPSAGRVISWGSLSAKGFIS